MPRKAARTPAPPLEEPVKQRCLKMLRDAGWWAEKVHGEAMQTRGTLDIVSCVDGHFLTLEGKRNRTEHMTPLQKYNAGRIVASGGWAAPVRDAELVRVMLEVGIENCCRYCLTPLVLDVGAEPFCKYMTHHEFAIIEHRA